MYSPWQLLLFLSFTAVRHVVYKKLFYLLRFGYQRFLLIFGIIVLVIKIHPGVFTPTVSLYYSGSSYRVLRQLAVLMKAYCLQALVSFLIIAFYGLICFKAGLLGGFRVLAGGGPNFTWFLYFTGFGAWAHLICFYLSLLRPHFDSFILNETGKPIFFVMKLNLCFHLSKTSRHDGYQDRYQRVSE